MQDPKRTSYKRTFQPKPQEKKLINLWDAGLPIDVLWAIYARQSTPAQLIKHPDSTEMQTDDLRQWLIDRHVNKDNIFLFDADLGKSGTLRIDQRTDLQELVAQIAGDKIKAVLVYRVSRLFRDETGVQYNVFANICREHNCILATADGMLFNFNNPMHLKMFRYLAEQAAEYIPQQLELLYEARIRKARKGYYALGGAVSIGYIVDYNETSKTYRKFILYPPHAEKVREIFILFYTLEGDFYALVRELEAQPVLFPDFEAWVDTRNIPKKRRKRVAGGYHISEPGLRQLLCNPVYLGWWIVQQEIVSRANHEAVFTPENEYLFWYAFERMAAFTVEGAENEKKRSGNPRRFYQKHTRPPVLLSKHKISSPHGRMFVHITGGTWVYQIINNDHSIRRTQLYEIDTEDIDTEVARAFLAHLQTIRDFDQYQQWLTSEAERQEEQTGQITKQLAEVDTQLEAVLDARLAYHAHLNAQLKKAVEENPTLNIEEEKARLLAEIAPDLERLDRRNDKLNAVAEALTKQQKNLSTYQAAKRARKFASFQQEVEVLIKVWDKKPLKERSDFLNLFLTTVVFTVMSPHWVRLDIQWRHPLWTVDSMYLYRKRGAAPRWTEEEIAIIRRDYPTQPKEEILQLLPTKTWKAIREMAQRKGVVRSLSMRERVGIPITLTWPDIVFMQEEGLTDRNTTYLASSARAFTFSEWDDLIDRLALLFEKYPMF